MGMKNKGIAITYFKNSNFKTDTYYQQECFKHQLYIAKKAGPEVRINAIRKLNNRRWARKLRGQIRIMDIFDVAWIPFKTKYADRLDRPGVVDSVEKAMSCGDMELGYLFVECTKCNNFDIVPFTCKSRFCPSCGKKYRDKISLSIQEKLYDVPHRQFVFSVPESLRPLFRRHRPLLNVLFRAAEDTLNDAILGKAPLARKKEHRQLGFVSFLHTFGRDLKWHPHLHILVAESYSASDGKLHHISYFPFKAIRLRFKYSLLDYIEKWIGENAPAEKGDFRSLRRRTDRRYDEGFYVYGPRMKGHSIGDFAQLAKYAARYASHPPISEGRIDRIDTANRTVTWHYDPHEDDTCSEEEKRGRQTVTDSMEDFIRKLIIHIPDEHFQQIRYYGFYSNRTKTRPTHRKMATDDENREARAFLRWERMLMKAFGYDPMLCHCGGRMHINYQLSYYQGKEFEECEISGSG